MVSRFHSAYAYIACGAMSALLGGCQQNAPDKLIVSGQVTYRGQSVDNGDVFFYPIDGTTGPISGASIKDGRYVADGKGGVPIGKHRIRIRAYRTSAGSRGTPMGPMGKQNDRIGLEGGERIQYIPAQYNSESTLEVVVGGEHTVHDFHLGE